MRMEMTPVADRAAIVTINQEMIADAAAMFDVSRVAMIMTVPVRRPAMSASTHAAAEIMAVVVPMRRLTAMLTTATGANSKGGMLVGPTGTTVGTIGRAGLGDRPPDL